MRTHSFRCHIVVLIAALATHSQARAQQPLTAAQELSQQAHQRATEAATLDELTQALRLCGQAAKANPTPEEKSYIHKLAGWTYNKRGETLVKLAESTAAADAKRAAEYEQAAIQDFGLAIRFDSSTWKPRFNRAVSVAIDGDYKTALADLDFVIEAKPKHENALFNRAEILLQLGQHERAVADYGRVIKLAPNDGAAYSGRGIALSALGKADDALLDLNAVVRLEPESATAYVDRADLYAALGNWERAAGDYRVAIGLDKTLGRAYQNVAWLMATCPEKKFRNPELAVRAAKKAIEINGQTYLGLDTYAAALAGVGQYSLAAAAQQKAISIAPGEEKTDLTQRLGLYQQQLPFIEQSVDNQVRLATAEEPLPQ